MASTTQDEDDCLGCRLTGTISLLGVSGYFWHSSRQLPRREINQRQWLLSCAGFFAIAGIWRATTGLMDRPKKE